MTAARAARVTSSGSTLPLHLALAHLLVKLHPLNQDREPVYPYSATFTAAVLHVVSREVFELSDRLATFDRLSLETDALVKAECASIGKRNERLRNRGHAVPALQADAERYESWMGVFANEFQNVASGCSYLDHLEREVRDRISEKLEEDMAETQEPFECHSPIALFLRSLLVSLRKLSFEDTAQVSRQIAEWCGIKLHSVARPLVVPPCGAETMAKRSEVMNEYQAAVASGDVSRAMSSLRRFYDHKSPASTKGQHAHALLSLAWYHYQTGGYDSAEMAVNEAIRIARKDGDKPCLQHCMSLLHQITSAGQSIEAGPSTAAARQATLSRLPKPATANDELIMLLTALDLGEPLPNAFQRIHLALARHNNPHKSETSWTSRASLDLGIWHTIQARMWDDMDIKELAGVHEDLALEAGEHSRWDVLLGRAAKAAKEADLDTALAILLDHDLILGANFGEYTRWAHTLWAIIQRQAELSEDEQALALISSFRHASKTNSRETTAHALRSDLRRSLKLTLSSTPAHLILPNVLSAVQTAREIGSWRTYRYAAVVLGEVLLKLDKGLGGKVAELVSGIWEGVMGGEDEEVKALAALVLGKAEIDTAGSGQNDAEAAEHAVQHICQALHSAQRLKYRHVGMQASTLLALLSDVSRPSEDDAAAREWLEWQSDFATESAKLCGRIQQVGEVVTLLGARVAQGWT